MDINLNRIFNSYTYEDIVSKDRIFIPPIRLGNSLSHRELGRLKEFTDLSEQELFDRYILHIENDAERPSVPFRSLICGYGNDSAYWNQKTRLKKRLAYENTIIYELEFNGMILSVNNIQYVKTNQIKA
jgi:hypothetical protein